MEELGGGEEGFHGSAPENLVNGENKYLMTDVVKTCVVSCIGFKV